MLFGWHYFSPLNTFMRKGKDPDPVPVPDPQHWWADIFQKLFNDSLLRLCTLLFLLTKFPIILVILSFVDFFQCRFILDAIEYAKAAFWMF